MRVVREEREDREHAGEQQEDADRLARETALPERCFAQSPPLSDGNGERATRAGPRRAGRPAADRRYKWRVTPERPETDPLSLHRKRRAQPDGRGARADRLPRSARARLGGLASGRVRPSPGRHGHRGARLRHGPRLLEGRRRIRGAGVRPRRDGVRLGGRRLPDLARRAPPRSLVRRGPELRPRRRGRTPGGVPPDARRPAPADRRDDGGAAALAPQAQGRHAARDGRRHPRGRPPAARLQVRRRARREGGQAQRRGRPVPAPRPEPRAAGALRRRHRALVDAASGACSTPTTWSS